MVGPSNGLHCSSSPSQSGISNGGNFSSSERPNISCPNHKRTESYPSNSRLCKNRSRSTVKRKGRSEAGLHTEHKRRRKRSRDQLSGNGKSPSARSSKPRSSTSTRSSSTKSDMAIDNKSSIATDLREESVSTIADEKRPHKKSFKSKTDYLNSNRYQGLRKSTLARRSLRLSLLLLQLESLTILPVQCENPAGNLNGVQQGEGIEGLGILGGPSMGAMMGEMGKYNSVASSSDIAEASEIPSTEDPSILENALRKLEQATLRKLELKQLDDDSRKMLIVGLGGFLAFLFCGGCLITFGDELKKCCGGPRKLTQAEEDAIIDAAPDEKREPRKSVGKPDVSSRISIGVMENTLPEGREFWNMERIEEMRRMALPPDPAPEEDDLNGLKLNLDGGSPNGGASPDASPGPTEATTEGEVSPDSLKVTEKEEEEDRDKKDIGGSRPSSKKVKSDRKTKKGSVRKSTRDGSDREGARDVEGKKKKGSDKKKDKKKKGDDSGSERGGDEKEDKKKRAKSRRSEKSRQL